MRNNNENHNKIWILLSGVLSAACVTLAVGLCVSMMKIADLKEQIAQLEEREEIAEMTFDQKDTPVLLEQIRNGSEQEETAEEKVEITQMEETEAPTVTAVLIETEAPTAAAAIETAVTTEGVKPAEPGIKAEQPQYLSNLSGIAPGTIIEESRLDRNNLDQYFMVWKIEEGDNLYERINGKSYRANNHVPLSSLRYLKMPHYNFDNQIQVGEMVCSQDIVDDVISIFKELFEAKYQIQSMYLIDNYWTGDPDTTDSASIDVNNTSCFCYRSATGSSNLSNHAYGKAIDLNPQQNPYVSYSTGKPKWSHRNADDYIDRSTGLPHVITHEDLAYKVFAKYGFRWGGDWNNPKDYQHFDRK